MNTLGQKSEESPSKTINKRTFLNLSKLKLPIVLHFLNCSQKICTINT